MSNEVKHAPGPWENDDGYITASGAAIATVHVADDFPCWDGPVEELEAYCEANARLIAAAPDLLKALSATRNALRSYQYGNSSPELASSIADHADAAIAAATGSEARP